MGQYSLDKLVSLLQLIATENVRLFYDENYDDSEFTDEDYDDGEVIDEDNDILCDDGTGYEIDDD